MMETKNLLELLNSEEFFEKFKSNIWPLIEKKVIDFHGYSAVYIDFENFWYSVLSISENILNLKDLKEESINEIKNELKEIFEKIINFIEENYKTEIRFIKAFADFTNLPLSENRTFKIIDEVRKIGIETVTPYVEGYKDMSDRALIVNVMEDLFYENKNLDKIFIITGDIDYYPLFEFISRNFRTEFYILSFKNRLNQKYKDIFFMKKKIIEIDNLFGIDSLQKEKEKKQKCIEEHFKMNHLSGEIDVEKTLNSLKKYYGYLKFTQKDIEFYIKKN